MTEHSQIHGATTSWTLLGGLVTTPQKGHGRTRQERRKIRPVRGIERLPQIINVYGLGLGCIVSQCSQLNYGDYCVLEDKRQLNLEMDRTNAWRIDASVAIKQRSKHNHEVRAWVISWTTNCQQLRHQGKNTSILHLLHTVLSLAIPLCQLQYSLNWIQYGHSYAPNSTPFLCNFDYTKKYLSGLTRTDCIFIKARRGATKTASFRSVLRLVSSLG